MDAAHDKTDKILSVLEQRIKDTYTRSQAEISESWQRYMDEVDVRVKKLHKAVLDAEDDEQRAKTLAEYKRVVRNATLTNERYAAMVQETSERLSHVNEIALVCVNGELPKIYTLNYNETNNGIANAVNGYSFTLLDENTVRNLIESDETLLPLRHLDLSADMRWNTKKINAEVLQGIIQGESVADIASRFERVTDMNRVSALRNARTAVTGAENKGRMDGYAQAEKMGVKLKKRWMSALDNRVRHTHRALNGQMRENDKPFEVDGYEIMYPGDPMAAPEMVYNCRCTTVAEVMGADELKTGEVKPIWAESMTDEEYLGWTNERYGGIINKNLNADPISYKQFDTGDDVNNFFYYDSEQRGLLARKNSSHGQWVKSLSADERDAISWYTADGYSDINNYWRKRDGWEYINSDNVKDASKQLDSAISRYELKDNIVVQRGVEDIFVESFSGVDINSENDLIGRIFTDKGYGSSTALHGNPIATAKPVMYEIEVPAGVGRGAYINQFGGQYQDIEYEFLFARDSKYVVTDVVVNDEPIPNQIIIKMRLIVDE